MFFIDPDGRDYIIHTERDEEDNIIGYRISGTYYIQEGDEASYEAILAAITEINATEGTVRTGNWLQRLFGTGPTATVTFDLSVEYSNVAIAMGEITEGGNSFQLLSSDEFNNQYNRLREQMDLPNVDPSTRGGVSITREKAGKTIADQILVPDVRNFGPNLLTRTQHEVGHTLGLRDYASPVMNTGVSVLPRFGPADARAVGRVAHRHVIRDIRKGGTGKRVVVR